MYRLNIVSTNPTGSVQQQQQQQGSVQTVQSVTGQPTQLTLVQQPIQHQHQSTVAGGGAGAIQIIGLTSLNALTNATTITGLAASSGSSDRTTSNSTAVVTAQKILKAAAANNNNSISIVKIGDEIMLKAVKVEPMPVTDSGGGGKGGGAISATTSGGVTVTAIPVQAAAAAAAAPASSGATGTVNGNVIYGGKRRLER